MTDTRPKREGTATTEEGEGSRARGMKNLSPQVNPVEIETFDSDSIPPTPTYPANARFHEPVGGDAGTDRPQLLGEVVQDADDQALAAEIAALSDELGDDAPASSVTRAANLRRDAGLSLDRFVALLDEAAARTRDRQASIVKRRRDGQALNGMPYLFAVLADLLHPAPPRTRDGGPNRRRGARRWQPEAAPVPVDYGAWTGAAPAPAPDTGDVAASSTEENLTWRHVLDELRGDMLHENYARWFGPTRVLDDDGATLRIAVPDAFHQQWLDRRLRPVVERALARIAAGVRVEFVVGEAA